MKVIFYKFLAVAGLFFISVIGFAQERPIYTHFMFNQTALNPAYASVHESLNITGLVRKQWVGIDGAPGTQTLIGHAPIKNTMSTVGAIAIRDQIGVTSKTDLSALYAYKIRFNEKSTLSFGLQAGVRWLNNDYGKLYSETEDDQFSQSLTQSKFLIGSGIFYHTERFYAGFSAPAIQTEANAKNHYFLATGYVFDLNRNLKLKPHALLKMADNAPLSYDLNVSFLFHDIIWLGGSYRSNESVGLLTEFQITNDVRIGYSYDVPAGDLSTYSNGSHEIMLNYRYQFPFVKYKSPRCF